MRPKDNNSSYNRGYKTSDIRVPPEREPAGLASLDLCIILAFIFADSLHTAHSATQEGNYTIFIHCVCPAYILGFSLRGKSRCPFRPDFVFCPRIAPHLSTVNTYFVPCCGSRSLLFGYTHKLCKSTRVYTRTTHITG